MFYSEENLNIFDAHLHIIDPAFPLHENNGFLPEAFRHNQYIKRVKSLSITSGAIVSGSFQKFDQSYLLHALKSLGNQFVGVTQLPASVSDQELIQLNEAGVRALRFNVRRGGSESVSELSYFADRVYGLVGWHVELYANHSALKSLAGTLENLPAVSVDHLGLNKEGIPLLKRLVELGVKVKATGFGRLDFDAFELIAQLYEVNPDAVMFGTDLPSTRAPKPFEDKHLYDLLACLDELAAKKVCWSNARNFYGFKD